MPVDQEKLAKLKAAAAERAGGMRRKPAKVVHNATSDDKKVQGSLKKLGLQPLGGIEEANLFHQDSSVTHISNPRVQANFQANTYVLGGKAERKSIQELMPGILPQLGMANLGALQEYIKLLQTQQAPADGAKGGDIPDVDSFETK
jgi:nascent polypeptide-associated complex subunit beta